VIGRSTLSRLAVAVLGACVLAPHVVSFAIGEQTGGSTSDTRRPGVTPVSGARDPAWSADGAFIAFSLIDQIWTASPDRQTARVLVTWEAGRPAIERDPAWSPDGRRIAFAADRGEGFDIYLVAASGGAPERLSFLTGDERWPAWTTDGRVIFAHHAGDQWDLVRALPTVGAAVASTPEPLTETPFDEIEPRVSPDGAHLLFVSNRDSDGGDVDLWVMSLPTPRDASTRAAASTTTPGGTAGEVLRGPALSSTQSLSPDAASIATVSGTAAPQLATAASPAPNAVPTRILRMRGQESSPAWAPDGRRIAFSAVRQGLGSLWVAEVDLPGEPQAPRPAALPFLVSRRGGQVAWSPDGRTLLVSDAPDPEPAYNGNPRRDDGQAPPLFVLGERFNLRMLPAPRVPDDGALPVATRVPVPAGRWLAAFEEVWRTLSRLYYREGAGATNWQALHDLYAPRAAAARDEVSLEAVVDAMVAEQPLIKPAVSSSHAVVVSGHRLASEAGVRVLERGGNIVDAAIAVSFTLGVVEPDASGIGGDGMALVHLKGMTEPAVIEYKDQTPIHATLDNQAIFRDGRLVGDGPAAANIPGVVAGLDMLYQKYGSKRLTWEELIAPAIRHAEDGFVLDDTLPTSIAEGQSFLRKYEAAREIFLPGGRVPRAGDRFVNRDYGATLRAIAKGGAREFYQGSIARRIAADMADNDGIIGPEDLAQYRAVERQPLVGRYRDHVIYAAPPPVASGASLIESLHILDHYTPRSTAPGWARDPDYFHYVLEAWKHRHGMTQVADPALWPVNIAAHLDRTHAATLFHEIDPARASALRAEPGQRDESTNGVDLERVGGGTTAFVVADAEGNMIAVTQTLSTWGGSFYVSKGLGFLYNNHLRSSRLMRGAFGQLLPLTRSTSTSAPTLLFRDANGVRTPRLAVGAAGNAWILSSVYAIVTNVVDRRQPMQSAVEAPRFLVGRDPADASGATARIQIEDRFPQTVLADLMRRGHVFQKIGRKGEVRYGYASGVLVDLERRLVEGGADPRRSHVALSWTGSMTSP
jgi:gamma-glutamyltranspeptidase